MSAYLMGRVFYADLPGHLKLCLLALADHAHDDGSHVFPGQARLARKVSVAMRTVRWQLVELQRLGYLVRAARLGPHGATSFQIPLARLPTPESTGNPLPPGNPLPSGESRLATHCHVDRQPIATEPSVTIKKKQPSCSPDSDFDTFWMAYPRKVGKPRARKAWRATVAARPPLATVLAAVAAQAASEQWQDRQFVPHPATWLNDYRWEAETLEQQARADGQARRARIQAMKDAFYAKHPEVPRD